MIFALMIFFLLLVGWITDQICNYEWSYEISLDENKTPPKKHPYFILIRFKHKKRILENI